MRKRAGFAIIFSLAALAAIVLAQSWSNDGASAANGTAITAGGFHACALNASGGVKCWGQNASGQLGNGTTTASATPVDVTGLTSGVASISAGGSHTCAVATGGGVKCWGANNWGQLGNGTTTGSSTPVDVSGLSSGVTMVRAGGSHTCAVLASGAVRCWGKNDRGQLGNNTTTNSSTPVDVSGFASGGSGIIGGGGDSSGSQTCAVTSGGTVRCWGRNDFGQIGNNTAFDSMLPVDVSGFATGGSSVAAGRYHSCARTTGGGVRCWGWNITGQLGDGTTTTALVPVNVSGLSSGVNSVSAGGLHTCAVTNGGGAKCWGSNSSGEIGDGTSGNSRTSPVDVLTNLGGPPLANVSAIAGGGMTTTAGFTCALVIGGIKCWGDNSFGQLGDGTTVRRSSPVDVLGFPGKPPTPTPTNTATSTSTVTSTATDTPTNTSTPTNTATDTPTATPTDTPTSTSTPTNTATSTSTATSTPTNTATNTPTAVPPTQTPVPPTATSTRTATSTATRTSTPNAQPTATATKLNPTEPPKPTATPLDDVHKHVIKLRVLVQGMKVPPFIKEGLLAQIDTIEFRIERGMECPAAAKVRVLIFSVQFMYRWRLIPASEALPIIETASALLAELQDAGHCPGGRGQGGQN